MAPSSNITAAQGPPPSGPDPDPLPPPRQGKEGVRRAIGLMSGTSLDGIDVATVETDGVARVVRGPSMTIPYPADFRDRLRGVLGGIGQAAEVESELTRLHAEAVEQFLDRHRVPAVDVVGMHGHTIVHRPAERRTWQLGDGAALALRLGIDV